jgi:pimeloyl-ACP methyl ester carboxylesterase
VFFLQRAYPAQGKPVEVAGAILNVVDVGRRDAAGPPIVMIHGASSNLEIMRQPLGDLLARKHRVILIDRPGHGWSTRARNEDSTPAIQGRMIDEALGKLGVNSAIFVVHSWAGALGARMALDYPQRVAGLVMLAPVAYPWPGGVGQYNKIITTPVIGRLLAYTITLPLGYFLAEPGARGVFLPQTMPDGFVQTSATPLLLRPREFLANARDLVTLKAAVAEQAPRYAEIKAPVVVISGDGADKTVSTNIHSRPFAATVPNARLTVLPGVGHMVQNAAPDLVMAQIDAMIGELAHSTAAAAN